MIGRPSTAIRVPASAPCVPTNCLAAFPRFFFAAPRRRPGIATRIPDAAYRSERTTRNAAYTNNQSRARNPALVSCITSSGTGCDCSRLDEHANTHTWTSVRPGPSYRSALAAEHQRRMADADDVAVRELPSLHWLTVHRRAIGRTEVSKHGTLTIPGDLQVPPGHAGVGQPEVRVLAATHHVAALLQRVVAVRAVVELQAGLHLPGAGLHGGRRVTL